MLLLYLSDLLSLHFVVDDPYGTGLQLEDDDKPKNKSDEGEQSANERRDSRYLQNAESQC